MEKEENLHKELDLIQSAINRMANNCFLIKGWTMTLISALFAFGKDSILEHKSGIYYLVIMIGILIPFWWLDAYYLKQERVFRKVYERAINDPGALTRIRYDLKPREMLNDVKNTWEIMWVRAVGLFYFPFLLFIALGILLKIVGLV